MPFLEETADLSSLSPTGPNSDNRDMTRGSADQLPPSKLTQLDSPDFLFVGQDRSGFTPLFNDKNLFTVRFGGSRLEDIGNNGFFESYYGQMLDNTSPFGIRNDNQTSSRNLGFSGFLNPKLKQSNAGINIIKQYVFGQEPKNNTFPSFEVPPDRQEPFIVREIGKRWGVGNVEKPRIEGAFPGLVQIDSPAYKGSDVVKSVFSAADEIGKRVLGREPSVFLDRYFADVRRINGATNSLDFLVRGSRFVQAQQVLQRKNPFERVSTRLYNLSEEGSVKIVNEDLIPEAYRQYGDVKGDAFSTEISPQIYNPLSIFSIPGALHINRNGFLNLDSLVASGTIFDFISQKVWNSISEKASVFIKDQASKIGKKFFKKKAKQLYNDGFGEVTKDQIISQTLQEAKLESLVKDVKKRGESLRKVAKDFELIPSNEGGRPSKATLSKLGQNAFSDKGVDKVNLIPYGKDSYSNGGEELPLDELDWIPFKFKDVRNNKSMVFRAILSGITDTFSPEYSPERYVGRPDPVYVYQGTSREIGFTFDVYPKSDQELVFLWEKLNYLAGQTYPHWSDSDASGGRGMISPFTELTIGQMYTDTPGYISALTYNVMDTGTYETVFAKLPKYIQVNCTFVYIGKRLPSATQKHYEIPWVAEEQYLPMSSLKFADALKNPELYNLFGSKINLASLQSPNDLTLNQAGSPKLNPPPKFNKSSFGNGGTSFGQREPAINSVLGGGLETPDLNLDY